MKTDLKMLPLVMALFPPHLEHNWLSGHVGSLDFRHEVADVALVEHDLLGRAQREHVGPVLCSVTNNW